MYIIMTENAYSVITADLCLNDYTLHNYDTVRATFKWLDVNKLCLKVTKFKFMILQMPQKKFHNCHLTLKAYT